MEFSPMGGELDVLDARAEEVRQLLAASTPQRVLALWNQIDLSSIYHDWALEGQVLSSQELSAAFDDRSVTDAGSLPLYKLVRAHKAAIDLAREMASRKRFSITLELFKELHALLASNPEEARTGRYRKEIPLHRAYFHEIADPAKIPGEMRALILWANSPSENSGLHPLDHAVKFHHRFMRIFPFTETSGKVGRAMMNVLLMRSGYLPAVIHATERQRYYEAIRQSEEGLVELVADSELASLDAAERFLKTPGTGV